MVMAGDREAIISYIFYILAVGTGIYAAETTAFTPHMMNNIETKNSLLPMLLTGGEKDKHLANQFPQFPATISKNIVCTYGTCSYLKRRKRYNKKVTLEEPPAVVNGETVLSPFPTLEPIKGKKTNKNQRNKVGRGNKNYKYNNGMRKNNAGIAGEDLDKNLATNVNSDKKGKKKMQSKKLQVPMREDQTQRRLRQHMQHKKKVKQFLRKRIQEQIKQRSQNRDGDF